MTMKTQVRKRAISREGQIVTSYAFPSELHRQVRQLSLDMDVAANEIVREAVERHVTWLRKQLERERAKEAK